MIFDVLGARESRSMENPSRRLSGEELSEWMGERQGVLVNPETALKLAAVYSCVYVLSSSLAQLPLVVMRKVGDRIEAGSDHAAYYLLHDEPNRWQTSYKWRETKQHHVLGWGNGYSRMVRSKRGELVSIETHLPQRTSLVQNGNRWLYATQDDDGYPLAVAIEDMAHVRALGSNGKTGVSIIRQHADTIGLGLAAVNYGREFFEGGGRPTGLVTAKGALNDNSWARLKSAWATAVSRLRQSENKTLLLPADLDYKALTIAPEDAQFLDTRKMTRSEIAGLFNVPAHMINDLEKATFSNISEQAIQFVVHTMMPWVQNWEQELNRRVFTRAERKAGYYIKFNLAGLLRGTPKERAEFYRIAIQDGWMDRNEVRAFEDLNPRDGLSSMLINVNSRLLGPDGQPLPVTKE